MEEAPKKYKEALKIGRELVPENPENYLSEVATMMNNLGTYYSPQHRMEEARKKYKEALKIGRELVQKNP
jgi:tetratricopeptide (TPR) repeat protein